VNGSQRDEDRLARKAIEQIRAWVSKRKGVGRKNSLPCLAIKFCGGCNPSIERGLIARTIREALKDEVRWVPAEGAADLLLIIGGCLTACADRPEVKEKAGEFLVIAGPTISFITRK